jgi:hypothetical protein
MATHGYIINKQDNNECPFCNVRLAVDHILCDCKETEAETQRANIQNNIRDEGKDGMKQLIEYVKKFDLKEQKKNRNLKKNCAMVHFCVIKST